MNKKNISQILLVTTGAGLLLYSGTKFVRKQNKSIVSTEYVLKSERLPREFDGFRIAHISDLQSEYFGREQSDLLKKVEKGNPDIIAFTGDLLDKRHTDIMASMKAISGLQKIAPVYFVNGNHEIGISEAKLSTFYEEIRQLGVHLLLSSEEQIEKEGAAIGIMGIDENDIFTAKTISHQFGNRYRGAFLLEKFRNLIRFKKEGFNILLAHEPQYLNDYAETNADLILCGHAHGGQFRLPGGQGIYSPGQGVFPEFTSGLHVKDRSVMAVSRGLGNSRFPLRLNNPPEIVFITLKCPKEQIV